MKPPLATGATDDLELSDIPFVVTGKDLTLDKNNPSGSLIFEHAGDAFSIRRTYTFHANSYKIDIKDEVAGPASYWITLGTDFGINDTKDTSVHAGPVLLEEYRIAWSSMPGS